MILARITSQHGDVYLRAADSSDCLSLLERFLRGLKEATATSKRCGARPFVGKHHVSVCIQRQFLEVSLLLEVVGSVIVSRFRGDAGSQRPILGAACR
jgi:hypothetical protein